MKRNFYLNVEVYGAKHKLSINGVPASMDLTGAPESSQVPINQYLTSPVSAISLTLYPLNNEDLLTANTEAKIEVVEKSEHSGELELFNYTVELGAVENEPRHLHISSFNVDAHLDPLPWADNLEIDPSDSDLMRLLYHEFQVVYDWFAEKRKDLILRASENRLRFVDGRFDFEPGNRMRALEKQLDQVFGDDEFVLLLTAGENFHLMEPMIHASGKLISLHDRREFNHYIMYYNSEETTLIQFPLFFGFDSDQNVRIFF